MAPFAPPLSDRPQSNRHLLEAGAHRRAAQSLRQHMLRPHGRVRVRGAVSEKRGCLAWRLGCLVRLIAWRGHEVVCLGWPAAL
jgi:hypothetical protein